MKIQTDMMVEVVHKNDKLHINMDIEFPRLPCSVLSVDVEDMMGTHMQNVHNSIDKIAVDYNRRPMGKAHDDHVKNATALAIKAK